MLAPQTSTRRGQALFRFSLGKKGTGTFSLLLNASPANNACPLLALNASPANNACPLLARKQCLSPFSPGLARKEMNVYHAPPTQTKFVKLYY